MKKFTIAFLALTLFIPPLVWGNLNKHKNKLGVVYWHGDPDEKEVALTFDDGPNEPYTSEILNVLKEYGVKATFFMIGKNVERYPEVAKKIVEEGHAIGNHSYSHPDMLMETGTAVRSQLDLAADAIQKATGKVPMLFRPPYGADDPFTIMNAEKKGYVLIKWSVSSKDWERPGVDKIVRNVMSHVENGSIILMHDGNRLQGGDRSQTVTALKIIIPLLKKRGFSLVTIPDLLDLEADTMGSRLHAYDEDPE